MKTGDLLHSGNVEEHLGVDFIGKLSGIPLKTGVFERTKIEKLTTLRMRDLQLSLTVLGKNELYNI